MTGDPTPATPSWRVAVQHVAWMFPTGWLLLWGVMAVFP